MIPSATEVGFLVDMANLKANYQNLYKGHYFKKGFGASSQMAIYEALFKKLIKTIYKLILKWQKQKNYQYLSLGRSFTNAFSINVLNINYG